MASILFKPQVVEYVSINHNLIDRKGDIFLQYCSQDFIDCKLTLYVQNFSEGT